MAAVQRICSDYNLHHLFCCGALRYFNFILEIFELNVVRQGHVLLMLTLMLL